MLFWGLNGFFHWVKIPPSGPIIEGFVTACIETRFIMPTVKLLEIMGGALLLFHVGLPLVLAAFAPVIFVVSGLHVLHNPRPWGVLVSTTLPYLILVLIHSTHLLRLVH